MSNKLKNEIEKEFDKEKNYNAILSKVERVDFMKNFKIRYAAVAACMVALVGVVGLKSVEVKPIEVAQVELNINQVENMASAKLDAEMKPMEVGELPEQYDFVKEIKIPEELNVKSLNCVYTRKDFNAETYDVLHDYVLTYGENTSTNVIIKFSEVGKPLKDCFIISADQKTLIENVEFEISQYQDTYMATFSHNGINFDIETNGITEAELTDLLVSIISY